MKQIEVPDRSQVSPESQVIFDQLQKRIGQVPNLYATIGYSDHALKGMLDFEASLYASRLFTGKEKEAINLIVSQVNECEYCLASHTALAVKRGYSLEETVAIRKAEASDPKLNSALRLAKALTENKGKANQQLLDAFFDAGYQEGALMDLIGIVALRSFTNYVYSSTKIPVDFPLAPSI